MMLSKKFRLQSWRGRRANLCGVRIQVADMGKKEKSEAITVHNTTPQQVMTMIKFFLKAVQIAEKDEITVDITYRGGKNGGNHTVEKRG